MASVSRPLIECLLRIRNLQEFSAFKAYLEEEQRKVDLMLRNLNDDRSIHIAQGEARRLESILNLIEQSNVLLDKERRQ